MDAVAKTVEYAYPTSPNADRFKLRDGGWMVETVDAEGMPTAVAGYVMRPDAMRHAQQLDLPWTSYFLAFRDPHLDSGDLE